MKDHLVLGDGHAALAIGLEFFDQILVEAVAIEAQVGEFLSVDESTDLVAVEHQLVAPLHVFGRGALRRREAVLDQLEDDVERRKGEHRHHHASCPTGSFETRVAVLHVAVQGPKQIGLAVGAVPDGGVELGHRLHWQQALEEGHHCRGPPAQHVEIGACVTEEAAGRELGEQHSVDAHAAVGCHCDGQDHRIDPVEPSQPPDEVGALVAIEDRPQDVDRVDVAVPDLVEFRLNFGGDAFDVALKVAELAGERAVLEDLPDRFAERLVDGEVAIFAAGAVVGGEGGGSEPQELEPDVEADNLEQPAGHRVVERLGELEIHPAADEGDIAAPSIDPLSAGGLGVVGQDEPGGIDRTPDALLVQPETFGVVVLMFVPLPVQEAVRGAVGDLQVGVVVGHEAVVKDEREPFDGWIGGRDEGLDFGHRPDHPSGVR